MKSLSKLEKLKVQGCQKVDDESLAVLAAFPSLREVDLKGTSVTEKGLAMFRAAKPKAVVYPAPGKASRQTFGITSRSRYRSPAHGPPFDSIEF